MAEDYRVIENRVVDSRLAIELIAMAAAAGVAALFVKHEEGPKPFLKTTKQILAATLGAAILAALAMTKASKAGHKKEGTKFSVMGAICGVAAAAGLFLLAKRQNSAPHILTTGGPDVFKAQMGLLQLGYHVQATGQMDDATKIALKQFQASNGLLTQDGSLTPETSAYIDQAVTSSHAVQPFSPDTGYHPPATLQT